MHIVLFEGIASSGKTTLEKMLAEKLPDAKILGENETLMDLIDNRDIDVARRHLHKLTSDIATMGAETVIVDRFHLTHTFRTNADFKELSDIEQELKNLGEVLLVLLTIDKDHIRERIEETMERRKDNWKKGAQGSINEKVAYYTDQQNRLLGFAKETSLPTCIIDTTDKDWEAYLSEIEARVK